MCKFLENEGFVLDRQKGSHRFYRHQDGRVTVVPVHSGKDLKRSLVLVILGEIGMSREEFLRKYK